MLNSNNYILYASKHYTSKCIKIDDFYYDLFKRIKYIKKMLFKYVNTDELTDSEVRKVLNQFISFYNVFEPSAANKLLYFELEKELTPIVNSFLYFLNFIEKPPKQMDIEIYSRLKDL